MTTTPAITIRRTRRDDVPAIIAMLADDHLGRARERLEKPLPQSCYDVFACVDAQRFYERLGFARSHVGMVIRPSSSA